MNTRLILGAALCLSLAACSDSSPKTPTAGGGGASTNSGAGGGSTPGAGSSASGGTQLEGMRLPTGLVVKGAAQNAVGVAQCKTSAKLGDTVTVVGRIGGAKVPFNASRSVFTIVDPSLKACSDIPGDDCKTPWDYCCDRDKLPQNMATIEIVDAQGKVLPFNVRGADGLEPLTRVAVTGRVTERNDQGLFVVRAERINLE